MNGRITYTMDWERKSSTTILYTKAIIFMELEKDKGNLHGLTDRGMKVISKIIK